MLTTQSSWLSRPNSADDSPKTTHLRRIVVVVRIVERFTPIVEERRRGPAEPLRLASPVARRDTLHKSSSRIANLRHHPVVYVVDDDVLDRRARRFDLSCSENCNGNFGSSPVHEEVNGAPTVEFPPTTEENYRTAFVCPRPRRHRSRHRDDARPVQIVPYYFIFASLKVKSSHRTQGTKETSVRRHYWRRRYHVLSAVVSNNDNIVIVVLLSYLLLLFSTVLAVFSDNF